MDNFGKRISALLLIGRPAARQPLVAPRTASHASLRDGLAIARAARGLRARAAPGPDPKGQYSNQASI